MPYIIAFVISIILYLGGGWCFYNIFVSISPISDSESLHSIACNQLLVYGIWATVVNAFGLWMAEKNGCKSHNLDPVALGTPLALWAIAKWLLPLSIGFGVINVVLCVLAMTFCLGQWFDNL